MSAGDSSARRARDLILDFDRECDPFRHRVCGVSIWTALRFAVSERLRIALGGLTPRRSVRAGGPGRLAALAGAVHERRDLGALAAGRRRCDLLALTTHNRLRDAENGRYRNVYFDYFDPPLSRCLHLYLDSRGGRAPTHADTASVSRRALWPELWRAHTRADDGRAVEALRRELEAFLGREGCAGAMSGLAASWDAEVRLFVVRMASFRRILEGAQPALVLSDCYYDRTWAVAAARSLGVPVWELQHGVVYDGHMAYTFDPSSADAHRDTLPVPDRILAFGPWSRDILLERGFWKPDAVEALGFPRLAHHQRRFRWSPPAAGEPLEVLVSAQWILTDRLTEMLHDVASRVSGVRFTVKPHPLDAADAYAGIPGVRVAGHAGDFYELLRGCHIHCSVFSTTLLESAGLGVPTLIIGLPGSEGVDFLAADGAALRADGADAMVELLADLAADHSRLERWQGVTVGARERFWTPEPGRGMERLLAEAGVGAT